MQRLRVTVVGASGVGKTSLIRAYINNTFTQDVAPTVLENYSTLVRVNEHDVRLEIQDTAGHDEYDRIRPLSYKRTDEILLCFAVGSPETLKEVFFRWVPETRLFAAQAHLVLVGTKIDLRADVPGEQEAGFEIIQGLPSEEGHFAAERINAVQYVECSSRTCEGIKKVFDAAICVGLSRRDRERRANEGFLGGSCAMI